MTKSELSQRIDFLIRVVKKEIQHLEYSSTQVFKQPITTENLTALIESPIFAVNLEAFTSRFSRLQDTVGDKLLPIWLLAKGETPKTVMDNLLLAEKLNMLDSAEEWLEIRWLRNQMVHEYIESVATLSEAINKAHDFQNKICSFAQQLMNPLEKR